MVKDNKTFLIDSSAILAPYRQYYAFDLVPSFWNKMRKYFEEGKVVVLDKVWDELKKGGEEDNLSKWIEQNKSLITICSHKTEEIIGNYATVLQYIQTSELYKESAIAEWASNSIADPWIIAAAKANKYTIVTEEKKSNGISKKQKNKEAKIPDVANALGVETVSLFDMMRYLKMVI